MRLAGLLPQLLGGSFRVGCARGREPGSWEKHPYSAKYEVNFEIKKWVRVSRPVGAFQFV